MSDKTIDVMKEHLLIAEDYISEMNKAESKTDYINAMKSCTARVKAQYGDLEEVAEDFTARAMSPEGSEQELKKISAQAGDIYTKKVSALYSKMGVHMGDPDFLEAMEELDKALMNNPLFGESDGLHEAAKEISEGFALAIDGMTKKIHAETTVTEAETLNKIIDMMNSFLKLSENYVSKMQNAVTARKAVTATDNFVNSVKKMIPEMESCKDEIKVMMMRDKKPDEIIETGQKLGKVLGEDLKEAMKDKQEILADHKVKKSVSRLGEILNKVPF